jgi:hypothetical protein
MTIDSYEKMFAYFETLDFSKYKKLINFDMFDGDNYQISLTPTIFEIGGYEFIFDLCEKYSTCWGVKFDILMFEGDSGQIQQSIWSAYNFNDAVIAYRPMTFCKNYYSDIKNSIVVELNSLNLIENYIEMFKWCSEHSRHGWDCKSNEVHFEDLADATMFKLVCL